MKFSLIISASLKQTPPEVMKLKNLLSLVIMKLQFKNDYSFYCTNENLTI